MMRFGMFRKSHPLLGVMTALAIFAATAVVSRATMRARADNNPGVTITEAVAQAERTGKAVQATAETTETAAIQANPDGTLTASFAAGPVREPDPLHPGDWKPIDLTLQQGQNGLTPAVSAAATTFTSGGSSELATLAPPGSNSFTEQWSGTLPIPAVSGDTATYANVLPAIDLQLQALTAGFEQRFIVRSAPQKQLVLDIPLSLKGLSATVDQDGNLSVTDSQGKPVARAGTSVMFGAAIDPVSQEPIVSAIVPTRIVNDRNGPILEIRPDQSFFSNPKVKYPVTIDPSPNLSVTTDTYVQQSTPTSSYATDSTLKVGTPDGSDVDRALLLFPGISTISGNPIHVLSSTLNLYETVAGGCTATEVDVYDAASSWGSTVTWNSQPSAGTLYASASAAHGGSTCPSAWVNISTGGASGHTLADLVQNWANGSANNGVIVRAASETNVSGWKKFNSSEVSVNTPSLSVTYNTLPSTPTNLSTDNFGTSTPTLHATFSDPDGGTGYVEYSIRDESGTALYVGNGTTVSSGTDSPFTVPTAAPDFDSGYGAAALFYWTARAYDGTDYSAASSSRQALTDTSTNYSGPNPNTGTNVYSGAGCYYHVYTPSFNSPELVGSAWEGNCYGGIQEIYGWVNIQRHRWWGWETIRYGVGVDAPGNSYIAPSVNTSCRRGTWRYRTAEEVQLKYQGQWYPFESFSAPTGDIYC